MQIWNSPSQVPTDLGQTAVTIGIFDGVHRGHRHILSHTCQQAHQRGLTSVALTFHPHPRQVHNPQTSLRMICSLEDRLLALESCGLDATLVQEYTLEFASLSPREFTQRFLVEILQPQVVVVGEDMRFGAANAGDIHTLQQLGEEFGFAVEVVRDLVDEAGRRWSSTWVRELLEAGQVDAAQRVLGRPHRVRGIVVHGAKRGRQLGFPTANLDACQVDQIPADGVYAGWLLHSVSGAETGTKAVEVLPAAVSVGTNPQFSQVQRTVEAHVLGRADLDLYGEEVVVEFIHRLRLMRRFESLDALLSQMDEDLLNAAGVLQVPKAYRIDPQLVQAGTGKKHGQEEAKEPAFPTAEI